MSDNAKSHAISNLFEIVYISSFLGSTSLNDQTFFCTIISEPNRQIS